MTMGGRPAVCSPSGGAPTFTIPAEWEVWIFCGHRGRSYGRKIWGGDTGAEAKREHFAAVDACARGESDADEVTTMHRGATYAQTKITPDPGEIAIGPR